MTESQPFYNDIPDNTSLTRRKLRHLICRLYELEGKWDKLPQETKHRIWQALDVQIFRDIIEEMPR